MVPRVVATRDLFRKVRMIWNALLKLPHGLHHAAVAVECANTHLSGAWKAIKPQQPPTAKENDGKQGDVTGRG